MQQSVWVGTIATIAADLTDISRIINAQFLERQMHQAGTAADAVVGRVQDMVSVGISLFDDLFNSAGRHVKLGSSYFEVAEYNGCLFYRGLRSKNLESRDIYMQKIGRGECRRLICIYRACPEDNYCDW